MGPEKKIQDAVVTWARREYAGRLIARKFQAGRFGTNGWPDYDFITDAGLMMIEFKRPGGLCTPLQLQRHAELRALGVHVFVVDSADQGKMVIRRTMAKSKARRAS